MRTHGVKSLVFSSSATVYGNPQYLPLDEAHPTGGCTNPYGKSKFFIEEMIRDLCQADKVREPSPGSAPMSLRMGSKATPTKEARLKKQGSGSSSDCPRSQHLGEDPIPQPLSRDREQAWEARGTGLWIELGHSLHLHPTL